MAITKTVDIISVRYTKATTVPIEEPDTVWVDQVITIDDPDDDQLPIVKHNMYRLFADSDVSNEEQIVKDIFNVVFPK